MKVVYQANGVDHETPQQAIDAVEKVGSGHVIRFDGYPNIAGCLPAIVYKSSSMWSYHESRWHSHYIHDGYGDKLKEEKPH
jgi:hypothetical protein